MCDECATQFETEDRKLLEAQDEEWKKPLKAQDEKLDGRWQELLEKGNFPNADEQAGKISVPTSLGSLRAPEPLVMLTCSSF
jgi:hypothetical protein